MQLSLSPATIGTNLLLSLILLFLILLACTVFNQTLEGNHHELATRFAWLIAPFSLVFGRLGASTDEDDGRGASLLQGAALLLIVAAIYSGLDPEFGFNVSTLALIVSMTVGVGLLTLVYEGSQVLLSTRQRDMTGRFELAPLGIVIAMISVIITRVTDLHPGIVLGVIAGAVVQSGDERQEGRVVFGAMLGTLGLSLLALLLLEPFRSLSNSSSAWLAVVPETVAVTLFIGGIEGLLLNLLPLEFMEGKLLWRWSRGVWFLTAATVLFLFFHVVVNRTDAYTSVAEETGVQTLFVMCVGALLLAATFWFACRIGLRQPSRVSEDFIEP